MFHGQVYDRRMNMIQYHLGAGCVGMFLIECMRMMKRRCHGQGLTKDILPHSVMHQNIALWEIGCTTLIRKLMELSRVVYMLQAS